MDCPYSGSIIQIRLSVDRIPLILDRWHKRTMKAGLPLILLAQRSRAAVYEDVGRAGAPREPIPRATLEAPQCQGICVSCQLTGGILRLKFHLSLSSNAQKPGPIDHPPPNIFLLGMQHTHGQVCALHWTVMLPIQFRQRSRKPALSPIGPVERDFWMEPM